MGIVTVFLGLNGHVQLVNRFFIRTWRRALWHPLTWVYWLRWWTTKFIKIWVSFTANQESTPRMNRALWSFALRSTLPCTTPLHASRASCSLMFREEGSPKHVANFLPFFPSIFHHLMRMKMRFALQLNKCSYFLMSYIFIIAIK